MKDIWASVAVGTAVLLSGCGEPPQTYTSGFFAQSNYAITDGIGRNDVGPSIRGGEVEVAGALDSAALDAALNRHRNALLYCYSQEVASDAELSGTVVMGFGVQADGSLGKVEVIDSDVGDDAVTACLTRQFAKVKLPADAVQGPSKVSYTLVLSPS